MSRRMPQPYDSGPGGGPVEDARSAKQKIGDGSQIHKTGRAGLADGYTRADATLIDQVDRLEQAGVSISPRMRMAVGFAHERRTAAEQAGGDD